MKTKRTGMLVVIAALAFASLACDLSGVIPGLSGIGGSGSSGGNTSGSNSSGAVTSLWPDVPKINGTTLIQEDLPLEIRVAVQAFFSTITASLNNQGAINFVAYSTSQSPADVIKFYSAEKMKAAGWTATEQGGCLADTSTPGLQGGLCIYGRQTGANTSAILAIIPTLDTTNNKTDIFYARIDVKDLKTPTP